MRLRTEQLFASPAASLRLPRCSPAARRVLPGHLPWRSCAPPATNAPQPEAAASASDDGPPRGPILSVRDAPLRLLPPVRHQATLGESVFGEIPHQTQARSLRRPCHPFGSDLGPRGSLAQSLAGQPLLGVCRHSLTADAVQ